MNLISKNTETAFKRPLCLRFSIAQSDRTASETGPIWNLWNANSVEPLSKNPFASGQEKYHA
jgi:hypothetical protein